MISENIPLPDPELDGSMSVEKAIRKRRSIRNFSDQPISISNVSQLLWSVQGITDPRGWRAIPSAGALYPLETYLVAGKVEDIDPGVYRYMIRDHALNPVVDGDKRSDLRSTCLDRSAVGNAPATIVFCSVYERITGKYGERGVMYVHMEAGHACQNLSLQAVALGLDTVPIGAFRGNLVANVIQSPSHEVPIYIVPIGFALRSR